MQRNSPGGSTRRRASSIRLRYVPLGRHLIYTVKTLDSSAESLRQRILVDKLFSLRKSELDLRFHCAAGAI